MLLGPYDKGSLSFLFLCSLEMDFGSGKVALFLLMRRETGRLCFRPLAKTVRARIFTKGRATLHQP